MKKAYGSALYLDPLNTAAMMNLIGPLVLEKEYPDAAALTARALKACPDKSRVLDKAQALLKEFMDSKDTAAAKTLLAGWTAARPADVNAWHNLGLISLEQEDLDHAIACFKQVHQLTPEDNFAVAQLAKLYFQKKKGRECLDCCNKLLERGHEPLVAVALKARVLNFIGGYEQALDFLQSYIDHNSENDALWVVQSEIHEFRDNYDAAINALHNAKRILECSKRLHNADNLQLVDEKLQRLSAIKR